MNKKELDEILDDATKENYVDELISNKNKNLMFIDDNNSFNDLYKNKILEEKNDIETLHIEDENTNLTDNFNHKKKIKKDYNNKLKDNSNINIFLKTKQANI